MVFIWCYMVFIWLYMAFIWFYMVFIWFYMVFILFYMAFLYNFYNNCHNSYYSYSFFPHPNLILVTSSTKRARHIQPARCVKHPVKTKECPCKHAPGMSSWTHTSHCTWWCAVAARLIMLQPQNVNFTNPQTCWRIRKIKYWGEARLPPTPVPKWLIRITGLHHRLFCWCRCQLCRLSNTSLIELMSLTWSSSAVSYISESAS